MTTESYSKKITTPQFTLNFPKVFEPESYEGGPAKYSIMMLFDKGTDISALKNEVVRIVKEKYPDGKIPKGFKLPFRDGDEEREGTEGYENVIFVNANSKNKPKVVDKNIQPILDPEEIYSGCICRASVTAATYAVKGNAGVKFFLNNLQKVKEGEHLGFDNNPANDFDVVEDEEETANVSVETDSFDNMFNK